MSMIFRTDLTNKRNNKLLIIGFSHRHQNSSGHNRNIWNVLCDCGKKFKISILDFNKGSGECWECSHKTGKAKITKNPFDVVIGRLLSSYKCSIKKRHIIFDLSKEQFYSLIKGNCYYCGIQPMQECKHPRQKYSILYNGIDRLFSSQGYNKNNCVSCCSVCNYMKQSLSEKEFYEQILKIKKTQKSLNERFN